MRDREMTVVEHLTELRRRIIWVLAVFVVALIAGFYFAGPLIEYLKQEPIADGVPIISLHPSDALRVYMQFAFLIGAVAALPVALFHLWRFVSPGLEERERRGSLYFIPAACLLFIVGILFGYYVVFPMIMQFMTGMTATIGADPNYGIAEYFGFLFNMVIPFGILFQLPIIVMFLTRLRILNPMRLAKVRRLAYFGLAVVGITLTPPEIVSDIMVTIPLLLLYEMSIWLSRIVYRKQLREEAEWEKEYGSYETDELVR
ncbi:MULTISPECIES: twin-arginine translocase subunit TatC [Brevibacillus]|jgi:sec-independent protein translocase protein TatC|uniref:Sec-independent protein translocase protein TatC n=1 Tax=Brevibacillus parabrevis TaxID=54914 RepID=A0A4Y3PWF7_BREPA|nr:MULTISPECIES: twin-arginine translocase subunit TatC [Brevibacillus]MBU8715642.1 twin-arginine translocase subunit TatC [Brevibacillus parabrevis]MDH6353592.1 sec-independent protein translocase protein TatC [Brevibacillus sp. 1238]RNB92074.1 twin-arginine translocase subunit TatC [Brevibacillus parabrevis]UED69680.1 twin-arginine translocase subunit TatC [Brevibacillus sp. HD3.3A]GEB35729.1 Sec-independent protein translocase protein TatCy [Brevibacillus parabrevis]